MLINLRTNPYAGVNPHLQSLLQTRYKPGGELSEWPSFHSNQVTDITNALNQVLPETYIARTEQSLQLRRDDFPDEVVIGHPEPDISIWHRTSGAGAAVLPVASEARRLNLRDTLDPTEDFVPSVVIYAAPSPRSGSVVARIELISPSNKRGRSGYNQYRKSRNYALLSGTPLIEIDYIHEYLPPLMNVPEYPRYEEARPYNIYVNEPGADWEAGVVSLYGFGVDEPISTVTIPLREGESLDFDFNAVYQFTFMTGRWWRDLDYGQPPLRFETYTPRDQALIQAKMTEIAQGMPERGGG